MKTHVHEFTHSLQCASMLHTIALPVHSKGPRFYPQQLQVKVLKWQGMRMSLGRDLREPLSSLIKQYCPRWMSDQIRHRADSGEFSSVYMEVGAGDWQVTPLWKSQRLLVIDNPI